MSASTHLVTITDVNGGLVDNSYINYVGLDIATAVDATDGSLGTLRITVGDE